MGKRRLRTLYDSSGRAIAIVRIEAGEKSGFATMIIFIILAS